MRGENELQAIPPHLLQLICIGQHGHPIDDRGDAGQSGLRYSFYFDYFDNAEAAGSVRLHLGQRLQIRVVTEGRDIDTSLLGRLKYSRALFGLDLPTIDLESDLLHFAPRINRLAIHLDAIGGSASSSFSAGEFGMRISASRCSLWVASM